MKKIIFFFLLITIIIPIQTRSQSFSISEINSDDFPKIRASFIALDETGTSYDDLLPENFDIKDNGLNVNPTVEVECITKTEDPEVSVILVLDKSGSMDTDEDGIRRWDWVKRAAKSFVNTLKFVGRTKVAITGFARGVEIECNFTNDQQELIDSIETIMVGGTTRYDPPFLDDYSGVVNLLSTQPSDMRRIVVFLTDGLPDKPPQRQTIIEELQQANIQVYSITLLMNMNEDLYAISRETGGQSFAVYDKDELDNLYKYIALDVQSKVLCEVSWLSDFGCDVDSKLREVEIKFDKDLLHQIISRKYIGPDKSVAYVNKSTSILAFGNPDIGQPATMTVDIDPAVTALLIDSIYTEPAGFFTVTDFNVGNPDKTFPSVLDSGETRTIEVTFTQQGAKIYRQAALIFDANPCPPVITLVGGASQVRIVNPVEGDVFSTCDSIEITWTGVDVNTGIDLQYSINGGTNWSSIATNVSGFQYTWEPPTASTNYRIRAEVSSTSNYLWAKGFGGEDNAAGVSIAVQDDDLFSYVAGWFEGTVEVNGEISQAVRNQDIFVMRLNSDGNPIWFQDAGGLGADTAAGVCVDINNYAYVTGVTWQTVKFGNLTPTIQESDKPYCFVARYDPSGANPKVYILGAKGVYTGLEISGQKIKYVHDAVNPRVIVTGMYKGSFSITLPGGKQVGLPVANNYRQFTAEFDPNLQLKDLYAGSDNNGYSSNSDTDSKGNQYRTGRFSGSRNYGQFEITSNGKDDIFVTKYGTTPGSEHEIGDFAVKSPHMSPEKTNLDLGSCLLGSTSSTVFPKLVENDGELRIEIADVIISGPDKDDFGLASNIIGSYLEPGEFSTIEITISPSDIGPRTGTMEIIPVCGNTIKFNLSGEGICSGESIDYVDIVQMNVNYSKERTIDCVFKNINGAILQVTPEIVPINANPNEFKIKENLGTIDLAPDSCITLTIVFKPEQAGTRTARIEYNLNENCEYTETLLNGEGVNSDLLVEDMNWYKRRVNTVNDTMLLITNNSDLPVTLASIEQVGTITTFIVDDLSSPVTIEGHGTYSHPISFVPGMVEAAYNDQILIKVQSSDDEKTIQLDAIGIHPQMRLEWICADLNKVGTTSQATLRLFNDSRRENTVVNSVQFTSTPGDFSWTNGEPTDLIIPFESFIDIDVTFSPTDPGLRSADIEISSNTAIGDGVSPDVDDPILTPMTIECDAIDAEDNINRDFEGVLLCETVKETFEIFNTSNSNNLEIKLANAVITGDTDVFTVNLTDMNITPGNKPGTFTVDFKPIEEREYSLSIDLSNNSQGVNIMVNIKGHGVQIYYNTDKQSYDSPPGSTAYMRINANIARLKTPSIDELKFNMIYDESMVFFDTDDITPMGSGLNTWTANKIARNTLQFIGTGSMSTPFDGELFVIKFITYLTETMKSDLEFVSLQDECELSSNSDVVIDISNICYPEGRLITIADEQYVLSQIKPNPVSGDFTIDFHLSYEGMTSVVIINSIGETVHSAVHSNLSAGDHSINVPAGVISSGVHFIRISSGGFSDTKKLVVIE